MDSLIAAAACALAAGDALGALKRVSLREDPPALALRGIAMAQLGEHPRARELIKRAARGFGVHEELARARCVVAEAEVALAMRDLGGSPRALAAASATLESRDDRGNALHAKLIAVRRLLLLGRIDEAGVALTGLAARGRRARRRRSRVALVAHRRGEGRARARSYRRRDHASACAARRGRRGARCARSPGGATHRRRRREGAPARRSRSAPRLGRARR